MAEIVTWPEATAAKDQAGNPVTIMRGVNVFLVSHFETLPQGGALLHMMGGAQVPLSADVWPKVASKIAPQEPPAPPAK